MDCRRTTVFRSEWVPPVRLPASIEKNLLFIVRAFANPLKRCTILDDRPRLLRMENSSVLMFFDSEDQARVFPDNRGVEFVSVRSSWHRDFSIDLVFLNRVPGSAARHVQSMFPPQVQHRNVPYAPLRRLCVSAGNGHCPASRVPKIQRYLRQCHDSDCRGQEQDETNSQRAMHPLPSALLRPMLYPCGGCRKESVSAH